MYNHSTFTALSCFIIRCLYFCTSVYRRLSLAGAGVSGGLDRHGGEHRLAVLPLTDQRPTEKRADLHAGQAAEPKLQRHCPTSKDFR